MYAVVGCSECSALWVAETDVDSTGCPRCGRRHQFGRLEQFTTTESVEAARAVRAGMLAERSDSGGAFDAVDTVEADVHDSGVGDREFLAGSGVDPDAVAAAGEEAMQSEGSKSRRAIVEEAIESLDSPTAAGVVAYASEYGVPESATRSIVEKMVRDGVVTEDGDGYRML